MGRRKSPPYRVVVTKGDANLGGDDIDQALMVYCRQQVAIAVGSSVSTGTSSSSLWLACRRAKEQLCHAVEPRPVVTIPVPVGGAIAENKTTTTLVPVTITQEIFETIIMTAWLDRARTLIQAAQNDWRDLVATPQDHNIDEIILVGGTTRVPCIRHLIQEHHPHPLNILRFRLLSFIQ